MILAEFSMFPLGKGESLSAYVARSLEIVEASGIAYRMGPMGTTLEGEWDEVMGVVRRCYEAMAADCDRVECSIKIDARKGPGGAFDEEGQNGGAKGGTQAEDVRWQQMSSRPRP